MPHPPKIKVEYQGRMVSLTEASNLIGVSVAALRARYNNGLRGNDLLHPGSRRSIGARSKQYGKDAHKEVEIDGVFATRTVHCARRGLHVATVLKRVRKQKITFEEALRKPAAKTQPWSNHEINYIKERLAEDVYACSATDLWKERFPYRSCAAVQSKLASIRLAMRQEKAKAKNPPTVRPVQPVAPPPSESSQCLFL